MSREAYCRAVLDVLTAEQKRYQLQHLAKGVNSSISITNSSSSGINSSSSSGNSSSNSSSGCVGNNSCGSSNTILGGSSDGPIMVRLLLAIDRRRLDDMEDTVQLLLKLREADFLLLSENFREKKNLVL
jgi:hypothetical protein